MNKKSCSWFCERASCAFFQKGRQRIPIRLTIEVVVVCICASSALAAPIHDAAEAGQVERIKALIKAGANVNVYEKGSGLTPLHLAAHKGDAAQGASCADLNSSGQAFFGAAKVKDVKRCFAAGADANAHRMGWTVLHSAVTYGASPEVVAALLGAGARLIPEVRSVVPEPLRMATSRAANPEVVRVLLSEMAADPPAGMRKRLNDALQGVVYSNENPAVATALIPDRCRCGPERARRDRRHTPACGVPENEPPGARRPRADENSQDLA